MCKKETDRELPESISGFRHLSCVPKKGDPKKGTRRPFLSVMLGRPRGISETRPSGSDSPKCFSLGLRRLTGMFAWGLL